MADNKDTVKEAADKEENTQDVDVKDDDKLEKDACEDKPEDTKEDGEDGEDAKCSKKEKKHKKDKKDEKIEELQDRLVRSMAEFDNYRKRTDKEKSAMFEIGAKSIVEKILPVIDNFERGFAAATDEEKESPFYQGMDKIYNQMITAMGEAGVKAIEAVGNEFDPKLHNAVMHVEDESYGDNVVAEEFQKGYMYKDSVVRHSMVKVAN